MNRSVIQRLTVASSLIVGGLVLAVSSPAAAAVCTSGVEGDVNGDGYAEVAVSENGRSTRRGAVHVFYGRPKGLTANASGTALNDQYIDQDEPGVPGSAVNSGGFGSAVTFGDYNDDGCADLAVTAGDSAGGSVYIFSGSKSGLKMTGVKRITTEQLVGAPVQQWTGVGPLLANDMNDDGVTDLVAGAAGRIVVMFGSVAGLTVDNRTLVDSDTAGLGDAVHNGFGDSLTVGDFDGDGIEELAICFGEYGAGNVQIVEWNGSGFEPTMAGPLDGPSLGLDDLATVDEDPMHVFGEVMSAGDVDGDGDDDLASGMRWLGKGGTVALVKGSPDGLTKVGLETWTKDSPGVVGAAESDEHFGSALAMGRLDSGPTDDLAIGDTRATVDGQWRAGSVTILLGSPTGLTTAGNGGARFHQNTSGIAGVAEEDDYFGSDVAIANVQSKTQGSLVIGVPSEDVGTVVSAGQFHQLSIAASGPNPTGSITLNLDSTGVRGASRMDAVFGNSLG